MSEVPATARVYKDSKVVGIHFELLMCMATFADPDGSRCFPSIEKICKRLDISSKYGYKLVSDLQKAGELDRVGKCGRQVHYRIVCCSSPTEGLALSKRPGKKKGGRKEGTVPRKQELQSSYVEQEPSSLIPRNSRVPMETGTPEFPQPSKEPSTNHPTTASGSSNGSVELQVHGPADGGGARPPEDKEAGDVETDFSNDNPTPTLPEEDTSSFVGASSHEASAENGSGEGSRGAEPVHIMETVAREIAKRRELDPHHVLLALNNFGSTDEGKARATHFAGLRKRGVRSAQAWFTAERTALDSLPSPGVAA
jgi:hypothetical protein